MDIREQIIKAHSKTNTMLIVNHIGNDQRRFDILFRLFLEDEYRIMQRAAWIMSHCVQNYPSLIFPHIDALLENLKKNNLHDAIKRNSMRILQFVEIPEQNTEEAANIAFDFLNDKSEAIAIRVFAMTVLSNICQRLPDLKEELKILIEDEIPYALPAFRSRGNKILKKL